ncbi:MerR family transcriptional regulator [Salinibacterium xinjiangense]|uniref:MerR HTH family regulatory protein n=1 Tax=Salinibacterium xinjiangense TaxID=386302 RepID=A0A2C8YT43_9MICO|nr:MerR family transcriptional regulator [Salinibacterium xinjiangense]GGK99510.1 MerR family transcriptional regulator [Salinibacterium xinjiangense]SOE53743.1 MerR HTH family regulatory protein [Salinibacterium xinjiangense]
MKISELSECSGVSIASIKFYQREELLPEPERTSPNQAQYDTQHVDRLRLIRALVDVGGLSVATVRTVLAAAESDIPMDWAMGVAQRAIPGSVELPATTTRGVSEIDTITETLGWKVSPDNPGRGMAARVIDSYVQLDHEEILSVLPEYSRAAMIVAAADLASVGLQPSRMRMSETVVVGTVLGDSLFAGLRRMAQEDEARRRYAQVQS